MRKHTLHARFRAGNRAVDALLCQQNGALHLARAAELKQRLAPFLEIGEINESVQRNIWQYDIQTDGSIANKSKFINFDDFGMDGMRCDAKGNLYVTRYDKGTVVVLSPAGQPLYEIQLKGKKPSNITFGGPDGKTCFVTLADRGCIESFRAENPGAFFKRIH